LERALVRAYDSASPAGVAVRNLGKAAKDRATDRAPATDRATDRTAAPRICLIGSDTDLHRPHSSTAPVAAHMPPPILRSPSAAPRQWPRYLKRSSTASPGLA
jgi:hypothetical protein